MSCRKAPPGWTCTRAEGHGGPCAALPSGNTTPLRRIELRRSVMPVHPACGSNSRVIRSLCPQRGTHFCACNSPGSPWFTPAASPVERAIKKGIEQAINNDPEAWPEILEELEREQEPDSKLPAWVLWAGTVITAALVGIAIYRGI